MNERFENFFSNVYKDRWPAIWQALHQPVKYEMRKNEFYTEGLTEFYKMDPASIVVAKSLDVQIHDSVLDMCAAPGGKSLILAEALKQTGQLISNEISKDRRERLMRVFQDYILKDQRQNVYVKGLDGNQYGLQMPEKFDRVLCDVPCSGERHLIENTSEFKSWTEKRSRNLAIRQYSLLSSGWLACKPGGRIVYSTCSISPLENDEIIKKLKKRRGIEILREQDQVKNSFIEATEYGYQILPDTSYFGPMYFAVLLKV
jgi:16S rRNA C967 or C1407 C5-methylase (RsmB/RsmF family)